jgi:nitric oxide dioxygenase
VSNLLHSSRQIGDEVVLSAPFGDVVLEFTDRPVVLASAGIGVTPMAGMLSHLVKTGSQRKVAFLPPTTQQTPLSCVTKSGKTWQKCPTHP